MGNMSYCRFENTLNDLRDCVDYVEEHNLSDSENEARIKLIKVCKDITERYFDIVETDESDDEILEDEFKNNGED